MTGAPEPEGDGTLKPMKKPLFFVSFARTFRASVWGPGFYQSLPFRPLSFSVGYLISLILWVSFATTIILAVQVLPQARDFLSEAGPVLVRTFPSDLVLVIKDGRASVNLPEPIFIPVPAALVPRITSGDNPTVEHLIVVDTREPFSLERFREYRTFLFLTANELALFDGNGVRVQSLRDLPNTTIDRAGVLSFVGGLDRVIAFLPPLVILGLFVFISGLLALAFFEALVGGLLILVLARRAGWKYRVSYQAALHALSLPVILIALRFVGLPAVPFLSVGIFLAVVAANIILPLLRPPAVSSVEPPAPSANAGKS